MGGSGDKAGSKASANPWSTSSMMMDYHRQTMRPMPSRPQAPVEPSTHESRSLLDHDIPLGGGFGVNVQGPNAALGVSHDDKMTRVDAQANLGGAGLFHRNENHDFRFGLSKGWGGGARMHHGDMPGFGLDAGPLSMDVKSKAWDRPASEFPHGMNFGE